MKVRGGYLLELHLISIVACESDVRLSCGTAVVSGEWMQFSRDETLSTATSPFWQAGQIISSADLTHARMSLHNLLK